MFLFIRTVQFNTSASAPAAVQFGRDAAAYLNKKYAVGAQYGVEAFSEPRLYVLFQTESVDKLVALNGKLMQDPEWLGILNKAKDLWVDGSLKDRLVQLLPG